MSTQTLGLDLPRGQRLQRWSPRLVNAEFLKLRRRRGLICSALALTVLPMLVAYTVLLAVDGPAGGMENFAGSMSVLSLMSVVAAVLVGATVGTADTGAGVFRELVVTGRSRLALFAARVPAGLGFLLPIVGLAYAITATAATVFAGSLEVHGHAISDYRAPSGSDLVQSAGWLALVTVLSFALALGIASLLGSRGTSIGVLLGWWLVVTPVLMNLEVLGSIRDGLAIAALERITPAALRDGPPTAMSLVAAVCVLIAWMVVPLVLGAWRTCTRDA
jgi:ABC-2 family transporter protein